MGDSKPERLGGLEIDDEIEFGRLLDRDVGGLRPAQNLIDQLGGAPKQIRKAALFRYFDQAPKQLYAQVKALGG